MTGTNQHEMTLFQRILDAELANLDDDGIVQRLAHVLADPRALLAEYRALNADATVRDLWLDITTDGVFRLPAIRLAQAQAADGPVWMYRFLWETPVFGGMLKSTHALEIPFVFDTLDRGGVHRLTGDGPERRAIASAMHGAWIAFRAGAATPVGRPTKRPGGRPCSSTTPIPAGPGWSTTPMPGCAWPGSSPPPDRGTV